MIYKALESRTDEDIQIKVSYMEIYQEIGYDLLNTAARSRSVVHFPKVRSAQYGSAVQLKGSLPKILIRLTLQRGPAQWCTSQRYDLLSTAVMTV